MVRVYTLSNLVLVHFAENFSLCSKCFQSSYCTKVGFPSLPSPFPFIGKGTEKRGGEPFPFSHRAPRAFYFSMYGYFYWDTQRKSLRSREKTACIVVRISMFFFFIFIGCLSPLGMKSRFIKDGQISASSSMSDLQLPSAGRLHNTA